MTSYTRVATAALVGALLGSGSAFAIPAGDYDRTCRQVREGRDSLSASCRDYQGRWVRSTVQFASCPGRIYIQNIDGHLRCTTR